MITSIQKRDGRTAAFDLYKIAAAIQKAFRATVGEKSDAE